MRRQQKSAMGNRLGVWFLPLWAVFHGRIYERRCDLSPDGSLLIYRAVKYGPLPPGYVQGVDSWTAIGKPPYFTALIF